MKNGTTSVICMFVKNHLAIPSLFKVLMAKGQDEIDTLLQNGTKSSLAKKSKNNGDGFKDGR
jgi:hypothetical protein